MPSAVVYTAMAMLILGILPLPYGYYMLLRAVVCGVFGFVAIISYQRKNNLLLWIFGFMALLFNPLFKIQFTKEVWMIIDIVAASLLFMTNNKIRTLSL